MIHAATNEASEATMTAAVQVERLSVSEAGPPASLVAVRGDKGTIGLCMKRACLTEASRRKPWGKRMLVVSFVPRRSVPGHSAPSTPSRINPNAVSGNTNCSGCSSVRLRPVIKGARRVGTRPKNRWGS